MATVPPTKPDSVEPVSPPEKLPPLREPFIPEPPETEPLPPDIDR